MAITFRRRQEDGSYTNEVKYAGRVLKSEHHHFDGDDYFDNAICWDDEKGHSVEVTICAWWRDDIVELTSIDATQEVRKLWADEMYAASQQEAGSDENLHVTLSEQRAG